MISGHVYAQDGLLDPNERPLCEIGQNEMLFYDETLGDLLLFSCAESGMKNDIKMFVQNETSLKSIRNRLKIKPLKIVKL